MDVSRFTFDDCRFRVDDSRLTAVDATFLTLDLSRSSVDGSFLALALSFCTPLVVSDALDASLLAPFVLVPAFTVDGAFLVPPAPTFFGIFVGDLLVPGFTGLVSRDPALELPREPLFIFKLILLFLRTGIFVPCALSPSRSLFGVPTMGESADGREIRLAARTIELAVTPKSIIVVLSTLRCRSGDSERLRRPVGLLKLILRCSDGIRSILLVTLVRRGIFDGELSALLMICIRPF